MQDILIDKQKREDYYNALASIDYSFYVEHTNPGYKHGQHTQYLCNLLQDIMDNKIKHKRIIISMPPQHSKSFTVTETLPSYFIGNNPDKHVIVSGYSDIFAQKFGRKNKEKIRIYGGKVFGTHLGDKSADKEWTVKVAGDNRDKGGMISSGIGGQVTGKRANLLIIDDPIKNRQEANSITYRNRLWDEWESTFSTRIAEDGIVICLMTRWHEDDLAGRLIEEEGFVEYNFPALAEENDILGRDKDEPLWPWQYSEKYLKSRRKKLSTKVWNSLYQGKPLIEEGNHFQSSYYKYFVETSNSFILHDMDGNQVVDRRILKNKCICFQTIDSALKDKKQNDYSVFSTWYLTPHNDLLLYNVFKKRIQVPDLMKYLVQQKNSFSPRIQFIEDKASGIGLLQTAKRKGMTVKALKAETNKILRSLDISTLYENGQVYHNKRGRGDWLNDYEDELNKFPDGKNDDQVDTASYAGIVVARNLIKTGGGGKGFASTT